MPVGAMRMIGKPFYASRYWIELWHVGARPIAFGGFNPVLRPFSPMDEVGAVRDPCRVELALIAAVEGLRKVGERDDGWWSDRWTATLDGWRGYDVDGAPPPSVLAAIEGAYPLPKILREAHDEHAYWAWRSYMMGVVLGETGVGALEILREPEVDLVCQVRVESVRRLLISDLSASSIEDVETRLRMYAFIDGRDHSLEASVMRDLAQLKAVSGPESVIAPGDSAIRKQVVATRPTPFPPANSTQASRPPSPGAGSPIAPPPRSVRPGPNPSARRVARPSEGGQLSLPWE